MKNNAFVLLVNFVYIIIIPIMKAKKNLKIQIEHSHSIVDFNIT
jgi:hypothetical protein